MRTTVNLDDDVLALVKMLAKEQGAPIGKVLSDLARKGAGAGQREFVQTRNGIPFFAGADRAGQFGPEEVEAALAAEDMDYAPFFVKDKR